MKIVHILDYLPYYHKKGGGAERAAYNLIKLLEKKGHANVVISQPADLGPAEAEKVNFRPIKHQEKIIGYKLSFFKRIFDFDIFTYFQIKKILKKEQPDAVHVYNIPIISYSAILVAWKLKIPVYYFIYDYWAFCPAVLLLDKNQNICRDHNPTKCLSCVKPESFSEELNIKWYKVIHDYFLKKVKKFVVLSKASGDIVSNYGVDWSRISVIPLIVDEFNNQKNKKDYKTILYVGWIQKRKGLHVILNALAKIIKQEPEVVLRIASLNEVPEYKNEIDRIIKKEKLTDNIKWFKKIPRREFLSIFFNSAIVVVPEQWPNMSPVILLESMSAGKAIVASRIGGIPEFIKDGEDGYLVEPSSSEECADKIIDLLRDNSKVDDFGEKIRRKFINNFSQDIIYKKLIKCYEK